MFSWIWTNVLYNPILNISLSLYHLLGDNLGIAIIVIAILFRLILLPLVKNQTEMTRKMAALKPQLDALQKKYGNNKEKLAQEQMKLYKNAKYNPLGCLGSFIPQILIILVLFQVIKNIAASNLHGIYPFVNDWISGGQEITINTKFLGLELTNIFMQLENKFSAEGIPYLIIALLVGVAQYFTTKFTRLIQNPEIKKEEKKPKKKKKDEELSPEELQENMNKSTAFLLPAMTVYFAIKMPAFLSIYWIAQSFALIIQFLVLDWNKTKEGAQNLLSIFKKKKELEEKEDKQKEKRSS